MNVTFNYYLRKNSQNKSGEFPIYLRITKNRKHKYVSTGISVPEKYWNPRNQDIRKSHRDYRSLNKLLKNKMSRAKNIYAELSSDGEVTAKSIVDRLKSSRRADFFEVADELAEELKVKKKYYQSKTLKVVLKKLQAFEGSRELALGKMNAEYLKDFEDFLRYEYENSDSTINKNFEPIRKVIQKAKKLNLMSNDPFKNYSPPTRKRINQKTKLSMEQINKIENLDIKHDSWEWHVRNAFLFSFYSGGIRFGDLCCLKWKDVRHDKLSYRMNKNKKQFQTDLNQYQKDILSKYEGNGDDYIFPFLDNNKEYSDPITLRQRISSMNAMVNGKTTEGNRTGLKKIADMAGIDENITTHVARHSFSQYAIEEKGLTVYELMQSLRHSKVETTERYLKGLDQELANKALKKVF